MSTADGFGILKDVQASNQQYPEKQKRQKEILLEQRKANEIRHDEVFQILVKVKKILDNENSLSVDEIKRINNHFKHFEALSQKIESIENKVNDDMSANEVAILTEEESEVVDEMEKIVDNVENIINMSRAEIKNTKLSEGRDNKEKSISAEEDGRLTIEEIDADTEAQQEKESLSFVENPKDNYVEGVGNNLFGNKQTELKGAKNLSEQERETVEQSIEGIKQRFQNIDVDDEEAVAKFWDEVSEEIREEGGMTGSTLAKVMNVIIENVDNSGQSSFDKIDGLKKNLVEAPQVNKEAEKKSIEDQFSKEEIDVLVSGAKSVYTKLSEQVDWSNYDDMQKEEIIAKQVEGFIKDFVSSLDGEYVKTSLQSSDVRKIFKRVIS
ncbi:MAG TPA: hypothetical protein EYG99_02665 [Candidatus Pacebacteria bacterium]|nr:hypothetical protein [Candidatus Paceibacterota bacterium]